MKYLLRIITLPAILILLIVAALRNIILQSIDWLRYGGELITAKEDDKVAMRDIYKILKKQYYYTDLKDKEPTL